jgi:hypothetical protein
VIDPTDIRQCDRAWAEHDRLLGEDDWERRERERLADRCSVPLTYVDSLSMFEVETLVRAA